MLSHWGYGEMVAEREKAGGRREEKREKGERGPFIWSHPRYLPKMDTCLAPSATHITHLEMIDLPGDLLGWSRIGIM